MPLTPDQLLEFELYASDQPHRELECKPFLEHAIDRLIPRTPTAIIELRQELRSPYGRSDFLVVADLINDVGARERHLFFWELKAPQCYLVEVDDAAPRYRPTVDLVKAETQLLHYVHQAVSDRDLQVRWEVLNPAHIHAGGIIIGRDARLSRPSRGADNVSAAHSLMVRKERLYVPSRFSVFTWDRILDFVRLNVRPGLAVQQ